jgi:predicted dehydrogenase/threonine dehydrogenase-like Zn-dependent dehydrogenase
MEGLRQAFFPIEIFTMKQILQNMSNGETRLVDLPVVKNNDHSLLIQTTRSLISIGTEKMLVEFGKANVIQKARQQPEKVKMVMGKVATDGLAATVEAVTSKLNQPLELGYCNVGRVIEIGESVKGYKEADRVVSNGVHASIVSVPGNLTAKIPDSVTDEAASFVVLAAIGLQGIRLAKPTLGEYFVVTGLGLIGLLTVQLLRAQGCRVLGIDFDESKLKMARQFGAETVSLAKHEDPVSAGMAFSKGRGVDGVIITASTKSSDPVSQAAQMCRQRGRIVLVGVTGLDLNRSEFYEKELSFQVSCSYGPGRYDPSYEEQGNDYPLGFVRWTEKRNFEAILDMMADGRLDVKPLISHRFSFNDALKAYETLSDDKSALGIILQYPDVNKEELSKKVVTLKERVSFDASKPVCGFIGAGNYASRILIPAYKKAGAQLHTVLSRGGVSATHHGEKNDFYRATTDPAEVLENDEINTVAIVTQHNTHAEYVIEALKNKKNVFVEKPLALNLEELDVIEQVYREQAEPGGVRLMVGFNRRFAPQVIKMKELLEPIKQPKSFIMTMNAGSIPADTWVQDVKVGGGRIIGEACHYVDLMRYLAGSEIVSVQARRMGDSPAVEVTEDKASIILGFSDGSFGVINYFANGGKSFPKERIEVFAGDAVLQLDNFRKLKGYGWNNFKKMNLMKQDKGQGACPAEFLKAIAKGEPAPISADEIFEVSRVTIEAAEQMRKQ